MDERMRVALRVLTAVLNHQRPDATEVLLLRTWVAEEHRNEEPDQLARLIISAEIQRRRER